MGNKASRVGRAVRLRPFLSTVLPSRTPPLASNPMTGPELPVDAYAMLAMT